MSPIKDIGDMLVEEVLTDVATTYLAERKEVEDQIHLFGGYVSKLAQKEETLIQLVSVLNYLLLKKEYAEQFFQSIHIEPNAFIAVAGKLYPDVLPEEMPRSFSMKRKYIRLFLAVYDKLQKVAAAYMEGNQDHQIFSEEKNSRKIDINYKMVMHMAQLINEKITLLNKKKSPSSVLQFARSLNTEQIEKERVTGAMSSDYEERLNAKLVLKTIDMNTLSIKTYPELPETRKVRNKIVSYCKKRFKSDKMDISQLIRNLKNVIPSKG